MAALLTHRVIRPLTLLAEAVTSSRALPEELPEPVTGLKEIDDLTNAFRSKLNDMTTAIASRDRAEGEVRDREA